MTQPTEIPQNPVAKTRRFFKRHTTGRQEDRERKQSAAIAAREIHEEDKRARIAAGKKNGAIREAIIEPFALAFRQRRILKAMRDNDLTAADGKFVRDAAHSFRGRKAHRSLETDKVDAAHKGIKEIAQGKRGETDAHRADRKRIEAIINIEGKGFAGDIQKEVIKPLLEDPNFASLSPTDKLQAIQQRIQQLKGAHPEHVRNSAVKDLIDTPAQIQDTAKAVGALIDQLNQATGADPKARLEALDQYIIQHGLGKGLFGREKSIYSMQRTEAIMRLAGFSKFAVAAAITAASGGWAAPVSTYAASALIGYVTNLHRLNYEQMMYNLERSRGVAHIKTDSKELLSIFSKKGFELEDRSRVATHVAAIRRGMVNAVFGNAVGFGLHWIGETPIGQIAGEGVGKAGEKVSEGLQELGKIRPIEAGLKDLKSLEDFLGKLNPFDHHDAPKGPAKPTSSGGGKNPDGSGNGNTADNGDSDLLKHHVPPVRPTAADNAYHINVADNLRAGGHEAYGMSDGIVSDGHGNLGLQFNPYDDGHGTANALFKEVTIDGKPHLVELDIKPGQVISDTGDYGNQSANLYIDGVQVDGAHMSDAAHLFGISQDSLNQAGGAGVASTDFSGTTQGALDHLNFGIAQHNGDVVSLTKLGEVQGHSGASNLDYAKAHMPTSTTPSNPNYSGDVLKGGPDTITVNGTQFTVDGSSVHQIANTDQFMVTGPGGQQFILEPTHAGTQTEFFVLDGQGHPFQMPGPDGSHYTATVIPVDGHINAPMVQHAIGNDNWNKLHVELSNPVPGSVDHIGNVQVVPPAGDHVIPNPLNNNEYLMVHQNADGSVQVDGVIMQQNGQWDIFKPHIDGTTISADTSHFTPMPLSGNEYQIPSNYAANWGDQGSFFGITLPRDWTFGLGKDVQRLFDPQTYGHDWQQFWSLETHASVGEKIDYLFDPRYPSVVRAALLGTGFTVMSRWLRGKKTASGSPKVGMPRKVGGVLTGIAAGAEYGSAFGLGGAFIGAAAVTAVEIGRRVHLRKWGGSALAAVRSIHLPKRGSPPGSPGSPTPGAKRPFLRWNRSSKITGSAETIKEKDARSVFSPFTKDREFNRHFEGEKMYAGVADAMGLGTFTSEQAAREAIQAELVRNGLTKQEALDIQNGIATLASELTVRGGQIYRTPKGGSETQVDIDEVVKEMQKTITDPRRKALIRKHTSDAATARMIEKDVMGKSGMTIGEVQKEIRDRLEGANPEDIKAVFEGDYSAFADPAVAKQQAIYALMAFGKLPKGLTPEHMYEGAFGTAFHPTTLDQRLHLYQRLGEKLKTRDQISYEDLKEKAKGISAPSDPKKAVKVAKEFIEKTLEEPQIRTVFAGVASMDPHNPQLIALQRALGVTTQNPEDFANAVVAAHLNLQEAKDLYASPTPQNLDRFKMNGLLRSTVMTPDELLDLAEKVTGGPLPLTTPRDTLIGEITAHLVQQGVKRDVLERALQSGLGKGTNGGMDVETVSKEMRAPALVAELKQKTGLDVQGYAELVGVKGANPDEVIQHLAEGLAAIGIDAPTLHGLLSGLTTADPEQIAAVLQPVLLKKVMGQFDGPENDYIRSQIGLKVFGMPAPAAVGGKIDQGAFATKAETLGINPFAVQRALDEVKGRGVKQAGKFVERFNGIVIDALVRKFADPQRVASVLGLKAGTEQEAIESLTKTFGVIEASRVDAAIHGATTPQATIEGLKKLQHEAVIRTSLPAKGISAESVIKAINMSSGLAVPLPLSSINDHNGVEDPVAREAENSETLAIYFRDRKLSPADLTTALEQQATTGGEVVNNLQKPLMESLIRNSDLFKGMNPTLQADLTRKLGTVDPTVLAAKLQAQIPAKTVDDVYKAFYGKVSGGNVAATADEAYDRLMTVVAGLDVPAFAAPTGPISAKAYYTTLNTGLPNIPPAPTPAPARPAPTPAGPDTLRSSVEALLASVNVAAPTPDQIRAAARATGFSETQIRDAVAAVHAGTFGALSEEKKVETLLKAMHIDILPTASGQVIPNEHILVIGKLAGITHPNVVRQEIKVETRIADTQVAMRQQIDSVVAGSMTPDQFRAYIRSIDRTPTLTDTQIDNFLNHFRGGRVSADAFRIFVDGIVRRNP